MFSVNPDIIDELPFKDYIESPFVKSVSLVDIGPEKKKKKNKQLKQYQFQEHGTTKHCGGINSKLKFLYYPKYKKHNNKRRYSTLNKGSSSKIGERVMRQLVKVTGITKKKPRPKRLHKFTQRILQELEDEMKHTLVAAELPVQLVAWRRITQADLITRCPKGKFYMWEIKTGYPIGGFRKQGKFKAPLQNVDNTKYNHWELQRHYTHIALKEAGICIHDSGILHVRSHAQKGMICKVLKKPTWTQKLPKISDGNEKRKKQKVKSVEDWKKRHKRF